MAKNFSQRKNIIMNQKESQNIREKYLIDWQVMLIKQEIDLVEKQTFFKLFYSNLKIPLKKSKKK